MGVFEERKWEEGMKRLLGQMGDGEEGRMMLETEFVGHVRMNMVGNFLNKKEELA